MSNPLGIKRLIPLMREINRKIDQTMLKYDKGLKDYEAFVEVSDKYSFRSLVVPSSVVGYVASIAKTPVAGVAGFPYGYYPISIKKLEIDHIASEGGKEVDFVINLINVKDGNFKAVENEVRELVKASKEVGLVVKVIVETSVLTDEELVKVSKIVSSSGADFIKTNSGYGPRGASLRDIYLMRSAVGEAVKIKAAGGIRNALDAATFLYAGADVIGASSGVKIVEESLSYLKRFG